jgi:anti-sigma regulatory factor (Ser/Thr protein kinase)
MVSQARHAVAIYARACGASDATVNAITLAVSEAAANAVIHAFAGLAPGRVSVIAEAGASSLLIRGTDDGRGMTSPTDRPGLGLGLNVLASVSRSCAIRPGPRGIGTDVRMEFAAPEITASPTPEQSP